MIKNDRQYKLVKANLKKFQESLDRHDELTQDQELWARELHKATIAAEINELQKHVDDYEALKSGTLPAPQLDVLKEIPRMLIQKRIALGWTQEDLARRLHVRPQQVQQDESTNYRSASLERLTRVAQILQRARRKNPAARKTTASRRAAVLRTGKRMANE